RDILVCNTATYCLDEVSNHAMGLLLMLNRGLLDDVSSVRAGGWFRTGGAPPRRLAGQRLGLIGLGNIGRLVARKARGFGLAVVAYDPYLSTRQSVVDGTPLVELGELLTSADFISVHCPLNASTRHLLGAPQLRRAQEVARGGVQRTVNADEVGARQQLAELDQGGAVDDRLTRAQVGIVRNHGKTEPARLAGDQAADVAEADQAQPLTGQSPRRGAACSKPAACTHRADVVEQAAIEHQQQPHGVIADLVEAVRGRVAY